MLNLNLQRKRMFLGGLHQYCININQRACADRYRSMDPNEKESILAEKGKTREKK